MSAKEPPRIEDDPLGHIRALCLSFPETSERLSHGHPAFFIRGKKTFLMYLDDHHGDGRVAIWCAAPEGAQAMLTDAAPSTIRPAVRGPRGWIGVRLDGDVTSTRSMAPSRTPT